VHHGSHGLEGSSLCSTALFMDLRVAVCAAWLSPLMDPEEQSVQQVSPPMDPRVGLCAEAVIPLMDPRVGLCAEVLMSSHGPTGRSMRRGTLHPWTHG